MQRMGILAALVLMLIGLSACNTVEGIGRDIKKGGEAIEKAGSK